MHSNQHQRTTKHRTCNTSDPPHAPAATAALAATHTRQTKSIARSTIRTDDSLNLEHTGKQHYQLRHTREILHIRSSSGSSSTITAAATDIRQTKSRACSVAKHRTTHPLIPYIPTDVHACMQLARSLTCSLTRPTTYVKEWGLSYLEKSPRNCSLAQQPEPTD